MAGLDDLYKEIILDHYRRPRNQGELPPPALKAEGFNPLCGDEITVYIDVDDNDVITDVAIGGHGCSISQASGSMMSSAIKGKTVAEVRALNDDFKAMMSITETDTDTDSADDIAKAKAASGTHDLGTVAGAADAPDLSMGDLSALKGVAKFPVRIKCATLSWNTLLEALNAPQGETAS